MNILCAKIDSEGYFTEDVLIGLEELSNPFFITTKVPDGMIKPFWNGNEWVEKNIKTSNEEIPLPPDVEKRLKALEDTVMLLLDTEIPEG